MEYLHRLWRPHLGDGSLKLNTIRFGYSRSNSNATGESIVVCRTGDHRVEIHCHGGRMAAETIQQTLISFGARAQLPDRWRSENENKDEIAAEAREDLVQATTIRTTSILLDQMRGALQCEFDTIQSLLDSSDLQNALSRLKQIEERSKIGRHLVKPWQVVLAGPPNSGKSSLLNLLLGYSRAIVHEQAGTTRDLLSEKSSFDGWPIDLIDGAGIRRAKDAIEATGVAQTLVRIASADCVLLLIDKTTGWTETHAEIYRQCSGQVVLVETKSDLKSDLKGVSSMIPTHVSDSIATRVETSSVSGQGLKELIDAVVMSIVSKALKPGEPIPFRERHRSWIAERLSYIRGFIEAARR